MKRLLTLILTVTACTAWAQGTTVFVPGGLANVEGNSSSMIPFGLGNARIQQVYSASEFAFLGSATGRIENIWFRLDANAGTNMLANYSGISIAFSTTSRSPDGLSPVFDDNIGSDYTTSYGATRILLASYTPGLQPQPFSVGFQLSTPFEYIPSRGNLLLDIGAFGGIFNPVPVDGQALAGDSMSSVLANSGLLTSGTPETLGLVTRFDVVPVPEPSSISLLVLLASWQFFAVKMRFGRNRSPNRKTSVSDRYIPPGSG